MKYQTDITLKFKDGSTGAKILGPFDYIEAARDFANSYVSEKIRKGEGEASVVSHKIKISEFELYEV